jgi:hypothetical protein
MGQAVRFLFKALAWVALLAGLATAAFSAWQWKRFPANSPDLWLLGWGQNPATCSARLAANTEELIEPLTTIAEAFALHPEMAAVIPVDGFTGRLAVLIQYQDGFDMDGDPFIVTEPIEPVPQAIEASMGQAAEALAASGNAYAPWIISKNPDNGEILADLWASCRQPMANWIGYNTIGANLVRRSTGGYPTADILLHYKTNEELPERCSAEVPALDSFFSGSCHNRLSDEWVIVQEWDDYCAWLNERGWDGAREDREFMSAEVEAWFDDMVASGKTPCEVLG